MALQLEEREQRIARVQVATATFTVVEREQHLGSRESMLSQQLLVGMREHDLAGRGSRLALVETRAPRIQAELTRAERDRAGRDDDDLLPRAMQLRDLAAQCIEPRPVECAAHGVDE